jgi:hypothetical protein
LKPSIITAPKERKQRKTVTTPKQQNTLLLGELHAMRTTQNEQNQFLGRDMDEMRTAQKQQ